MSDRERIAQVAQDKWATVSKSLRSLMIMINERMSNSHKKIWLTNLKSYFLVCFINVFLFKIERFPQSLCFGKRCEQIAQVAHQKWAMWANRSGHSPKMSDHEQFAQVAQRKWAIVRELLRLLTKNERMSESLVFLSVSLICSFLDKKRAIR